MIYTPDQVRSIRTRLGLTTTKAAARIDVAYNTWVRWERIGVSGTVDAKNVAALREMEQEANANPPSPPA